MMESRDNGPSQMTGDSLGKFSLLTVFLVTVLLVGGLIVDKQAVTLAFVCGVSFFVLFGGLVILTLSGQLVRLIEIHQKERTVRLRDELHFSLYEPVALPKVEVVPVMALPEPPTAPEGARFIPAVPLVEEHIKVSAYEFINNLYENGAINPKRVLPETSKSPNQIQLRKPRPEVLEYLLSL